MTNKEELRMKRNSIQRSNIKFLNENPIDLEKYKGRDIEMLNAIALINLRIQTASLQSIEKNVRFFLWLTILGIAMAVVAAFNYL